MPSNDDARPPDEDGIATVINAVAEIGANVTRILEPLYEIAEGVKTAMIARGWSAVIADQESALVLQTLTASVLGAYMKVGAK